MADEHDFYGFNCTDLRSSELPLSNDELYREVQRETGMSDAELHELKEFGSDKTRTSGVKHKVRWFQQTLRQAGVIERVPEKRGVWRYSSKTKTNLHESWEKLCVVGFSTSLGASVLETPMPSSAISQSKFIFA